MKVSTVHLFVFSSMSDWEYGYAVAGVNNPQFQKFPGRFKVKTAAISDKPILTMGGLRVTPDTTLNRLRADQSAMLILPGGMAWDQKKNNAAALLATQFLDQGTAVAAICGATAGLARVGLLDAVPHTSNSREYIALTGYRGGAHFSGKPVVRAGSLITASAMSPLEFAREIVAVLGIYSEEVLKNWYSLYKTRDAKYFAELMKAAQR